MILAFVIWFCVLRHAMNSTSLYTCSNDDEQILSSVKSFLQCFSTQWSLCQIFWFTQLSVRFLIDSNPVIASNNKRYYNNKNKRNNEVLLTFYLMKLVKFELSTLQIASNSKPFLDLFTAWIHRYRLFTALRYIASLILLPFSYPS